MSQDKKIKILFLSTYPPRACGIATFTQDLICELEKTGQVDTSVAAVSDSEYSYPPRVKFTIEQQNEEAYAEAAEKINSSGFDLLMVEHEYGIFGGKWGKFLLNLTSRLKIPYFVTLHTVLPNPAESQKEIMSTLAAKSRKIITMASNTVDILQNTYGIERTKIEVVHHGVPEYPSTERDTLKKELGLTGRFIVSTFGLISPGKGLEYGIEAIARVAKKHPDILYFILGQTHPVVKRKDGEKYREKLERTVKNFGLEEKVRFVNRYLKIEEIIRYLQLSDVYMTPYLGKDQAVSGTLAYAAGYGRVIISTPYLYAEEMLKDGRGLLADFRSPATLAERIEEVMTHPEQQEEMERRTQELGKTMYWGEVSLHYLHLFQAELQRGKEPPA
ncbi:D-inositol-3-phosphate glycosyltransferase [Caprobacter fermentans]|uniref:D-inositol-3-phosphate glycosyltransferase n=1 Tax=Caproicibacter fermentans TaxID=2576756 RepID=A0A6N8I0I9_9FIRM|nr:glycosyltransferase family 4 protein [Caproicibacter fermentans]MVB11532.1 D-inositol-3-phosphate glycosyltransferase [Caproicibacter fermentans]OCN02727.1 glycosyl transferase family 1 [Clostridium sp. W14A]QNK41051.1 glycosyltransferase family 4 protein [Caproicibacter fermentans]